MRTLNRTQNFNTAEYWDSLIENRSGWWNDGLRQFLAPEIGMQVALGRYRYIEIGGGCGQAAKLVKDEFPLLQCWNVDFSSEAIKRGNEMYPYITHICHDVHYQFPEGLRNCFDILVCQEVIEHLENPVMGIDNVMDLVAHNGLVCFTFPYSEGEQDGFLHLWSFDYSELRDLFFKFTSEIIVCKFVPPSKYPNLWGCIKFWKTISV